MRSRSIVFLFALLSILFPLTGSARENARLLRQPTMSQRHVAFAHAGDLWIADRSGGEARRLTSTAAVESDPHFSPDGNWIAFSSNRSGVTAVYVLSIAGGSPKQLTWYPASASARGWTPDGALVLYSSTRATAPAAYGRLWTVSPKGGPSVQLPAPWGNDGSYSPDGKRIAIDRMRRSDVEWRHYRGGQNTPLMILNLEDLSEVRLPSELSTEIQPVWMGDSIYFLSDRDWSMNIFAYDPGSATVTKLTDFDDVDVKWLAGHDGTLAIEQDGWIHLVDASTGNTTVIAHPTIGRDIRPHRIPADALIHIRPQLQILKILCQDDLGVLGQ